MKYFIPVVLLTFLSACVSPVKVVQKLPDANVGALDVANVQVSYSDLTAEKIRENDAKRAERAAKANEEKISHKSLSDLIVQLLNEEIAERQSSKTVPVDVKVNIDTLKFANAGLTILLGDSDQLAGSVEVIDRKTGDTISEFYVDIIKGSGGLLGLAIRGGGVREGMASDFVKETVKQLYGKK
ncbi:hypothetical protein [Kordiimonas sp. SCSIO 12610]|uniref:hypothetical protein n=1 Tax=Kordiimonas sp. SCSIO 12610 TaxID=2829597 RepID=UPI00210CB708|nr:hypothetical protein [Kordiimonas sp. SCSIO 12610]UTW55961.1 hypothetical protein KFF44_03450 [Kordiimonas sp. SCSIO 12610]